MKTMPEFLLPFILNLLFKERLRIVLLFLGKD
jgi:hypothetical protein